ncbi:hypothetical protein ATANTOWER_008067 [Ataeniobius toweri]|uniref:Uncharacterized protein n=1 Tax=Ataeniobius toweri TaxID=208326 RepID=A0ABU7A514_9TELE|nr:hypothetical protein [Ataeniobius toweri]
MTGGYCQGKAGGFLFLCQETNCLRDHKQVHTEKVTLIQATFLHCTFLPVSCMILFARLPTKQNIFRTWMEKIGGRFISLAGIKVITSVIESCLFGQTISPL